MSGFILQLFVLVALPAIFIVVLWRVREPDRARWILKVLYTGVFFAYLLTIGRWDLLTVHLRYVLVIAYVVAVAASARRYKALPTFASDERAPKWRPYVLPVALLVCFTAFLVSALRGYAYRDDPVELEFPLRDGWFYVGHGGSGTLVNYHHPIRAQQYALDIVGLNGFGTRARGALPKDLSKYAIFGMQVYSPCAGRVVAAVDGLPDHIPPATDKRNVAGNHVVIACQGALVVLAHLRSGSVDVQEGDEVDPQTVVGTVGNSGNTSEPHLHIHAVAEGSGDVLRGLGVPMLFDGRFLVRNSTVRGTASTE